MTIFPCPVTEKNEGAKYETFSTKWLKAFIPTSLDKKECNEFVPNENKRDREFRQLWFDYFFLNALLARQHEKSGENKMN